MDYDLIPYGSYSYGAGHYKGSAVDQLHYFALKKLWPLPYMAGVLDDHFTITGQALDDVYYQNNDRSRNRNVSGHGRAVIASI